MRLFVDWDGTVTVEDSLVQVIHAFGDPSILAELEPRVGVDLTLHEEIAAEFAAVGAPLADVVDWVLENIHVRPGLAELAALRPVIVSAGFHELIEPGRGDFLLESVEGGATRGRHSLIGLAPDLVFRAAGDRAELNRSWPTDRAAFAATGTPTLTALRDLVASCRIADLIALVAARVPVAA